MGCDGSRPAECSRHAVLTAKARSPIVVHRVAGTMRSADDAERRRRLIPHLRPGRWHSAVSSVRTPERTGKPVRTACTGCTEVCAASGGMRGVE